MITLGRPSTYRCFWMIISERVSRACVLSSSDSWDLFCPDADDVQQKNDSETDVVLEKAIIVFRFLLEKDTFEVYYRRHLARRLLQHRSVSDDAERGVLAKLKIESGAAFVRDLEGMMKDVKLSADTMSAYRDHLNNSNTPMPLDLSVQVCTSSHWPLQQPAHSRSSDSAVFPPDFVKAIKSFEAFYLQRHSGRKLSWRADLGSVDVKIQFKSKKHEVNMSTQAMMVLSLFAELGTSDSLSLQVRPMSQNSLPTGAREMCELTRIDVSLAHRTSRLARELHCLS